MIIYLCAVGLRPASTRTAFLSITWNRQACSLQPLPCNPDCESRAVQPCILLRFYTVTAGLGSGEVANPQEGKGHGSRPFLLDRAGLLRSAPALKARVGRPRTCTDRRSPVGGLKSRSPYPASWAQAQKRLAMTEKSVTSEPRF